MDREILYKYRSLAGVNKERVERIFTESELYFPSPLQFNDPFDCRVDLSFEGTEEDWKRYVHKLVENHGGNLSPVNKLLLRKRLLRSSRLRNIDSEVLHQLSNELGVFSLSKVPSDILMWSHYADSHQGVCIGFYAGERDVFFRISQEVKYRPDYPSTTVHDSDMERMEATILTKSDHWKYEEEYRIVDYQNGPGIKVFPKELFACVILGEQIREEDRRDVVRWAKQHPASPKIFQAQKANRQFALELVEVPNK